MTIQQTQKTVVPEPKQTAAETRKTGTRKQIFFDWAAI